MVGPVKTGGPNMSKSFFHDLIDVFAEDFKEMKLL